MAAQGGHKFGVDPDTLECVILIKSISTEHGSYEEGTLYGALSPITQDDDVQAISLDNPDFKVLLPGSYLQTIDFQTRDLLRCIKVLKKRLHVLRDPEWLEEGKTMDIGDPVLIYNKKPPLVNESGGVLRYKGAMVGRKGIYFGIQLDPEHSGHGSSNGSFRNVTYFICEEDGAIFETIYNVRLNNNTGIPSNARDSLGIQYPPAGIRNRPGADAGEFNSIENRINEAVNMAESNLDPLPPPPQLQLSPQPPPQLPSTPSSSLYENPAQRQPTGSTRGSGSSTNAPMSVNLQGPPSQPQVPPPSSYQNQPQRQQTRTPRASSSSTSMGMSMNLQGPGEGAVGGSDVPIKVGERVVWVSDTGAYKGTVRWIGLPGQLDEAENNITAGVELDEPVGTGTGRYRGRDLFHCRKNHAAIMPIMGLMKMADFEAQSDSASASAALPPQNQEDEDLKRAIAESLKDQQRRSSSSNGPVSGSGYRSGSGFISAGRQLSGSGHLSGSGQASGSGQISGSGLVSNSGQISSTSSFPIKVPPTQPDQPESYLGEDVRHKKPSVKASQQDNSSSSGFASIKPYENPYKLDIGSRVEILKNKYGVIKWIGKSASASDPNAWMVGILMDKPQHNICTAGTFLGVKYFDCPPYRAFFGYLRNCKPETRPPPAKPAATKEAKLTKTGSRAGSNSYGGPSSLSAFESIVSIPDVTSNTQQQEQYVGRSKGIAGLEGLSGFISLLYGWFQFNNALDDMLCRRTSTDDVECFRPMRKLLRESILKPLRVSGKVHAETMKEVYATVSRFAQTTMGLDLTKAFPETYISLIVNKIFRRQLISLSNRGGADFLEITPTTASLRDVHFPSTKKILQAEMVNRRTKFTSVPRALHMVCKFERIHPILEIDIGEMVEGKPQCCSTCHLEMAKVQCFDCFSAMDDDALTKTFYCAPCSNKKHGEPRFHSHAPVQLTSAEQPPKSCTLHLSAVICYDENHFVTYAKCHRGSDSPWVKFDCMASSITDTEEGRMLVSDVAIVEQLAPSLTPPRTKELAAMKRVDMSKDIQLLCLHTHMCIYVQEQQ